MSVLLTGAVHMGEESVREIRSRTSKVISVQKPVPCMVTDELGTSISPITPKCPDKGSSAAGSGLLFLLEPIAP